MLGKAWAVLKIHGTRGLVRSVQAKIAQPGIPIKLTTKSCLVSLGYEDRWVANGESTRHSVSVIILSREQRLLDGCLASVFRSVVPAAKLELFVVSNGRGLQLSQAYPFPLRLVRENRPFNWSAYNNLAAKMAGGGFLLFLNDDVEALHGGWLDAMLDEARRPGVGAVGAKLLYPVGLIQHCGIKVGGAGVEASHLYKFQPRNWLGEEGELLLPRQVDAVTGACLLTPRDLFCEMGGFDEGLALSYNDVDYCLRLRQAGYAVVVTPRAELIHRETSTRPWKVRPREKTLFRKKWAHVMY